jgi:hypothetical protein
MGHERSRLPFLNPWFDAFPMNKKTKRLLARLGCAGLAALGLILAGFLGLQALASVTGRPYFDTPSGRAKLRDIREPLLVIPPALEAHRKIHGDYPDDIADLDPSVPRVAEVDAAFRSHSALAYRPEGDEFELYLKLKMDGGLWFSSASGNWVYDAGLSEPSWTIDR